MKTLWKMFTPLLLAVGLAASAQAASKIGVIQLERVFQQAPQNQVITQKLRDEFASRVSEIQKLEKELQELAEKMQRDGALMSKSQKTEIERKGQALQDDYRRKAAALQEDEGRRSAEERDKLLAQIKKAVDAIAKQQNYDLILQANAVAFVADEHDISEQVIKYLSDQK